ncbi:hypothetical protein N2152v2_004105 [Parachlorella kessleri]
MQAIFIVVAFNSDHVEAAALPDTLPFHARSFVQADPACEAAVPPSHSRVRVMSYNILADHLAHEHSRELYSSSPRYALEWGYRGRLIMREIGEYQPDVVCLQEVDHFRELQMGLEEQGYEGLYTKRTGDRRDGLATFWRKDVFRQVKHDRIYFTQLGLKDNVAQVVLLQRRRPSRSGSSGSTGSRSGHKRGRGEGSHGMPPQQQQQLEGGVRSDEEAQRSGQQPLLAVGNIHVLFNPRRGDIKIAQVRTLFDRVRRLSQEHGGAPAVICGDFNSAAGSPVYQYISHGLLDLSQHDRRRLSGQVEAQGKGWPSLRRAFLSELYRAQQAQQQQQQEGSLGQAAEQPYEGSGCDSGNHVSGDGAETCCSEGSALGAVLAREASSYDPVVDPHSSLSDPPFRIDASGVVGSPSPNTAGAAHDGPAGLGWSTPSPPTWQGKSSYSGGSSGGRGRLQGWTPSELQTAMGGPTPSPAYQLLQHAHSFISKAVPAAASWGDAVVSCPLHVESAYHAAASQEPLFTTCHDKFIGTVDYIWYTPHTPTLEPGSKDSPAAAAGPAGGSSKGSRGRSAGRAGSAGGARFALRPLGVLQPPSLQSLATGLPSGAWPSDHVSLVADFALVDTQTPKEEEEEEARDAGGAVGDGGNGGRGRRIRSKSASRAAL